MARQGRRRYDNKKRNNDWVRLPASSWNSKVALSLNENDKQSNLVAEHHVTPASARNDAASTERDPQAIQTQDNITVAVIKNPEAKTQHHVPVVENADGLPTSSNSNNRQQHGKSGDFCEGSQLKTALLTSNKNKTQQSIQVSRVQPSGEIQFHTQSRQGRGRGTKPVTVTSTPGDNSAAFQKPGPAATATLSKGSPPIGKHVPRSEPKFSGGPAQTRGKPGEKAKQNGFQEKGKVGPPGKQNPRAFAGPVPRSVQLTIGKKNNGPKQEWPRRHVTSAKTKKFPLHDLPEEIIELILSFAMPYHKPMEVDHRFAVTSMVGPKHKRDGVSYAILRANSRFYRIGLPFYYSLNDWVIPLNLWTGSLRGEIENWGKGLYPCNKAGDLDILPPPTAKKHVHSIILHIRNCGSWYHAIGCLKAFPNLRRVVFDFRQDTRTNYEPNTSDCNGSITVEAGKEIEDIIAEKGIPGDGKALEFVGLMHEADAMERNGVFVKRMVEALKEGSWWSDEPVTICE